MIKIGLFIYILEQRKWFFYYNLRRSTFCIQQNGNMISDSVNK